MIWDAIVRNLAGFRGSLRIEKRPPAPESLSIPDGEQTQIRLMRQSQKKQEQEKSSWLEDTRRLIPGPAFAGYISLQALGKVAKDPQQFAVFLALVFCAVTILLSWWGSQDPKSETPSRTAQIGLVLISTASFIALVYATGGQIWWHRPVIDQNLYAQVIAVALGILGPVLYRKMLP